MNLKYLFFTLLILSFIFQPISATALEQKEKHRETKRYEAVILLHGLGRTARSMQPVERMLKHEGYKVYNLNYPSTEKTIEDITQEHLAPLVEECLSENPLKLHFVAHSLGNIVIRNFLKDKKVSLPVRHVMLGPPNQGSEVVDKLGGWRLFKWLNGKAGQQLGTDADSVPLNLPPVEVETGVVAGSWTINPLLSLIIPGPDDGKVSLERARVEGMKDYIVVKVPHTFLMNDHRVFALIKSFLRNGKFHESNIK